MNIPQELRGKIAVPFLEWFLKNTDWEKDQDWFSVANFYSQPFTVDMLVNKEEKYELKQNFSGIPQERITDTWQEAESLRIFEGWRIAETNKNENQNGMILSYRDSEYMIANNGDYLMDLHVVRKDIRVNNITLNDFVTLCSLNGIELKFKE
jgi:hypothetical protein